MNSDYYGQKKSLEKEIFGNQMTGKEVRFRLGTFRKFYMNFEGYSKVF